MKTLGDDLFGWWGFWRAKSDISMAPRWTSIPLTLARVDMPPCQPCKMEAPSPWPDPPPAPPELPVSCLVLGIVKSIERGDHWGFHSMSFRKSNRIHQSGMMISYPDHLYGYDGSYHDEPPHKTSSGHVFNAKEARLIEDAFKAQSDRSTAAYVAEIERRNAETNRAFVELGCAPSQDAGVPPYKDTVMPITIKDNDNNRRLWALLHDSDPVKRRAAEEATKEMMGRVALMGWTGRDHCTS